MYSAPNLCSALCWYMDFDQLLMVSQTFHSAFDHIRFFPPKTRHRFTRKWRISKYPKSKNMDFWQFQTGKTTVLAKLNMLKCQFYWELQKRLTFLKKSTIKQQFPCWREIVFQSIKDRLDLGNCTPCHFPKPLFAQIMPICCDLCTLANNGCLPMHADNPTKVC